MDLARLFTPLMFFPLVVVGANMEPQGANLTVTSQNLKVTFRGADVIGVSNLITGESYLRPPASSALTKVGLTNSTPTLTTGAWALNAGGNTASLSLTDGTRTVAVTVGIDATNQEITVVAGAQTKSPDLAKLHWGITGFDLNLGRFVLPAAGGISLGSQSFASTPSYTFSATNPTSHWDAPLSLFQTSAGGVAIYSRDTKALFRGVTVTAGRQQTADESFIVEAPGPWSQATSAGPIEWRLAAYRGDWQAGARIYRDWHNAVAPPVPLTGARAWAGNIRTVVRLAFRPTSTTAMLDSLARTLTPSRTMLYLSNWRKDAYDENYPDYTPHLLTQGLVDRAHQLGFYVMLHTDIVGVSPLNADYALVQQFHAKDPATFALQGWNWSSPVTTPTRYGLINPASSTYRKLFVDRLRPAMQALKADALHLDFAGPVNDGNGLIEGLNYNQGEALLHQDLLTAFPGLILGTEGTNDVIAPFGSFVQQMRWPETFFPDSTPPVPISAYVLANVVACGHLGMPNPNGGASFGYLTQYEGQAVLPTYGSDVTAPNYTQPDFARYMKLVAAFQQHDLQPDWDAGWNGAIIRYRGANGALLTVTDDATLIKTMLRQASGDTLLYQRVHNSNQITADASVPNWPAYTGRTTTGLDPAQQYWLDAPPNDPKAFHLDGLPLGVKLGIGADTVVTPDFAYFKLLPTVATGFDFFQAFATANVGTTYAGVDGGLVNNAAASVGSQTVGGVARQSIFLHPPFTGPGGGESFVEYSVPIPDAYSATLTFAAGILDNAAGSRRGPMTFRVLVNGATAWTQNVSTGAWQAGSVALSAYLGQTVKIRIVSNPGPVNDSSFARGAWSALQLSTSAKSQTANFSLTLPAGALPAPIGAVGANVAESNGSATVTEFPLNNTAVVFLTKPRSVALKHSLLELTPGMAQSTIRQLARVANVGAAGLVGAFSAGGQNKQRALYNFAPGFSPSLGQTVLSWPLELPDSPAIFLSFSAGLRDDALPRQGLWLTVRVNGIALWRHNTGLQSIWKYGAVDLSPWSGQSVLVELVADTGEQNYRCWTAWGELAIDSSPASTGATVLNVTDSMSVAVGGATGTVMIAAPVDTPWIAEPAADWIKVSPPAGSGNGSVSYTILPNGGPSRTAALVVAGHLLTINQAGSVTASSGRLSNLSILTNVTAANPFFTVGTVVGGQSTSGTKPLLIRAAGPSLTALGVGGALADPKLDVFSGQAVIASNDDWGGTGALGAAFASVAAFPYSSASSKDAAIYNAAMPSGSYTVQVGGVGGATGTVIAELYDATPNGVFTASTPRLINVSVLKEINAGEMLTAGFVIGGSTPKRVLVRAVGPTLSLPPFNVGGAMTDPRLDLFRGQTLVNSNDNWGGDPTLSTAGASVGAFALGDRTSKDAVLLAQLAPGSYTVQVSGVSGAGGLTLVEVYEIP